MIALVLQGAKMLEGSRGRRESKDWFWNTSFVVRIKP